MNKQDLIYLCGNAERALTNWKKLMPEEWKVELVSELKPFDHYIPQIHIGTSSPIQQYKQMAWFVEIYVGGKCVIRESYIPKENEDLKIVEGMLITRTINNIFFNGVMGTKIQLEKLNL